MAKVGELKYLGSTVQSDRSTLGVQLRLDGLETKGEVRQRWFGHVCR